MFAYSMFYSNFNEKDKIPLYNLTTGNGFFQLIRLGKFIQLILIRMHQQIFREQASVLSRVCLSRVRLIVGLV